MKKIALHWQIIIGLLLGVGWAVLATKFGWTQFTADWISPFGKIFVNLLKLIAVPLVLFSIISGISGLEDVKNLGKLGAKTIFAYLVTTVLAVTIGLSFVNLVKPGNFISDELKLENRIKYEVWAEAEGVEVLDNKCVTCDPANAALVAEMADSLSKTEVDEDVEKKLETAAKQKKKGPLGFLVDMVPDNLFLSMSDNKLMLQVIFFAIFFGITLLMLPRDKTKPVIDLINGVNEVFLKMVDIVMLAAPYFVFALMAGSLSSLSGGNVEKIQEILQAIIAYSGVVVAGLALLFLLIYPLTITLFTKIGYLDFFKRMAPAQTLAFSTSSSAATLPVTMECVEENMGVSSRITSFVLPIGATVNMDGTSLYQTVAAVFLAQMFGVDLTLGQQLMIVLTATLASIGSAAVPSGGVVMLIVVMQAVGLNPAWVALILPVDRILDMCRTTINVTGDATVSTLIAKSEGQLNPPEQL